MKRFLFIFLVLVLAAGFAAGQDLGLTAGLEFGIGNVGKTNDVYLMPMIIYETAFFDGALDLSTELDYTFGFGDELAQSLYFDFFLGYNLSLGSASTLSFILENEFDELEISPDSRLTGIFTPAVKFNQGFDFGDIYAQIGVPITYLDKGDTTTTGLDFTLGWGSAFGLGLEAVIYTMLAPGDADYVGLEATVSYETGPIYCEINIYFPKEVKYGITITPEFDYALGSLTLYTFIEFAGIGVDGGEVSISPALGVKYSF